MGSGASHTTHYSIKEDKDGHKYFAEFQTQYFAFGGIRYAFKGILHGKGPRNGSKCVVKIFQDNEYANEYLKCVPDSVQSKKAAKYAKLFQTKCYPRLQAYKESIIDIEFIIPLFAQIKTLGDWYFMKMFPWGKDDTYAEENDYVAIEQYLEGRYVKFNSNNGYEDGNNKYAILLAFSHWTWYISGHKYMVCDLQGVLYSDKAKAVLTDPAIHSVKQKFGPTDGGSKYMEKVLRHHKCNHICKALGLKNPYNFDSVWAAANKATAYILPEKKSAKSTKYTFPVTEEDLLET